MTATLKELETFAADYGMAAPDAILSRRPEIVTERPTLPRDLDPEWFARNKAFYDSLKAQRPGYLLGNYINPYRGDEINLIDRGDRFALYGWPTRSGKGVSFAFPNLLGPWIHSIFVNDPKKELCAGTAWWRKYHLGHRIFIVEPFATDGRNARFNPLFEVRLRTRYEVSDVQTLATAIVDPDGSGFDGDSGVWKKRARTLMAAVILHVLYSDMPEKSLRTVDSFLSDPETSIAQKYQIMKNTIHDPENVMGWTIAGRPTQTHPVIAMAAQDQIDRPDGEAGSVKSEMQSYTEQYRNQTLGDNTAHSDFSIADLVDAHVPATVFFVITPDTLSISRSYVRLFFNLLINRNTGAMDFDENARPLDPHYWSLGLLLDEFVSTLGSLPGFANELAFIAGYKLRPALIIQDISQLESSYKEVSKNILANMHTLGFAATSNKNSQEFFSQLLGQTTHHEASGSGQNKSIRSMGMPLLAPSDIGVYPADEAVIKRAGEYAIPIKKLRYYADDSVFASRVRRTDFASDRLPLEHQLGYQRTLASQLEFKTSVRRERESAAIRVAAQASATATLQPPPTQPKASPEPTSDYDEVAEEFAQAMTSATTPPPRPVPAQNNYAEHSSPSASPIDSSIQPQAPVPDDVSFARQMERLMKAYTVEGLEDE